MAMWSRAIGAILTLAGFALQIGLFACGLVYEELGLIAASVSVGLASIVVDRAYSRWLSGRGA